MLNTFQEQSTLQIPIQTQKFIFIDNHLLIPLIALNATQIYNVLLTSIYKFRNLIKTSLEM
jgi:hypothetical protein